MTSTRSMSRIILQHLNDMRQRLVHQDATLHIVHLWPDTKPSLSSTYIAMFLEEPSIQKALYDCLKACAASRVVTTLHLGNLPEPDLEAALLMLAQQGGASSSSPLSPSTAAASATSVGMTALEKLYIGPLNASSGLSGKVLTKLLQIKAPQLKVVDCSCRVRLPNQAAVHALAAALQQLPALQHLRLHVVPRTSIERPSLRLDAILNSCRGLETLEFTAGYPDHNPYQQPIIRHVGTLAQFMARNPNIRTLSLANLGLATEHVQALTATTWPECLEQLHLPSNTRLCASTTVAAAGEKALSWAVQLAEQLQDPHHTTLVAVTAGGSSNNNSRRTTTTTPHCRLLQVDVWTTLNRLGRHRLVRAPEGSAAHVYAFQDLILQSKGVVNAQNQQQQQQHSPLLPLNLIYTLVRENPTLAVQSMI